MKLRAKFTWAFLGSGLIPLFLGTIFTHTIMRQVLDSQQEASRVVLEDSAKKNLSGLLAGAKAQLENYTRRVYSEARSRTGQLYFLQPLQDLLSALPADDAPPLEAPEQIDAWRAALRTYYEDSFAAGYFGLNGDGPAALPSYIDALSDDAVALQYSVFVAPAREGEPDHAVLQAYRAAHAEAGEYWRDRLDQSSFAAAYVIDSKTGRVLYTTQDGLDLGASLRDGPLRDSPLGEAFKEAREKEPMFSPGNAPTRGPGGGFGWRGQGAIVNEPGGPPPEAPFDEGPGGPGGPLTPGEPGGPGEEPGRGGGRGGPEGGRGNFGGPGVGRGNPGGGFGGGPASILANRGIDEFELVFTDFAPYFPDQDAPAAFVAHRVVWKSGADAVIALKLTTAQLDMIMKTAAGMGDSVNMQLIGPDFLPRTNSIRVASATAPAGGPAKGTVMHAFRHPQEAHINNAATRAVFELGTESCVVCEDAEQNEALFAYSPVDFLGKTWALIASINTSEAFAAVNTMKQDSNAAFVRMRVSTDLIALASALALCMVAVLVSIPIVRPLRNTVGILRDMAQGEGDLSRRLIVCSRDEVAEMARWFNLFMDKVQSLYQSIEDEVRERKRAEEKAAELAVFPRENPNPIFSCTEDGTIIYVNPAGQRIAERLKLTPKGLLPCGHADLVAQCLGDGETRETECTVAGRVLHWRYNPVHANREVHLYAHDISVRKQAEQKLKEYSKELEQEVVVRKQAEAEIHRRERYYKALIENAPDVIMTFDRDFRCTYASPAFERNFGYPVEEVLGRESLEPFHPEDRQLMLDSRVEIMKHPDKPIYKQWRLRHRDGEYRIVESRATNRLDDDTVGGIVINMHDVTERERAQEILRQYSETLEQNVAERTMELLQKSKDLEKAIENLKSTQDQLVMNEKMASLGALTAGIAHEIKNPLNFVNNFGDLSKELVDELAELIEESRESLPQDRANEIAAILKDLRQNATKIVEHGKRADSIVHSMLLHSRGKAGERQPTDINALLDEYVNLTFHGMRARDASFNIDFDLKYDATLPKARVVPQDIARVFLNIINNACYAAHKRAQAKENGYKPLLSARTREAGDRIEIVIRDNGTGIPPEIIDDIFNPFYTTKPAGEGTGLGLSISYDIVVREHGGELRVASEPGEFTEFTILLPKS